MFRIVVLCPPARTGRIPLLLAAALLSLAARGRTEAPSAPAAVLPERAGTLAYRDARLEGLAARGWEMYLTRADRGGEPVRDPKRNRPFPFSVQVVCAAPGERPARRFVVHFQSEDDHPRARHAGSVLARLYWLGRDYLGRGPTGSAYVHVWLTRDGAAGGEEYEGSIYLFAVQESRVPAEWARELAHEYGHVILPRYGPFTQPERWANGYLGERLLLKWLLVDNGPAAVWGQPVDGPGYLKNALAPLRDRFLAEGPLPGRADAAGMERLIGQLLAVESLYGPALLRRLLDGTPTPDPELVPYTLADAAAHERPRRLSIDPAARVAGRSAPDPGGRGYRRLAYRLFLPPGEWRITARGQVPPGTVATLEGQPLPAAAPSTPEGASWRAVLSTTQSGWRLVELTAPGAGALDLTALECEGG